jgi:FKBP-type peptidyl-prolyl cis-trans isomerase
MKFIKVTALLLMLATAGTEAQTPHKTQAQPKKTQVKRKTTTTKTTTSKTTVKPAAKDQGFQTTANGLQYKFITSHNTPKPEYGDLMGLNYVVTTDKDSEIMNTFKSAQPVELIYAKPAYHADPTEGFGMLSLNDSAILLSPADDIFKDRGLPPGVAPHSMLTIRVKLIEIVKADQIIPMEKERAKRQPRLDSTMIADFLKMNNIKATRTASGLYYIIDEPGTGPNAQSGQTVSVNYTGKLMNGKVFDSSYPRNAPIEFQLGTGGVIRGWDEGIALLNKGAKARLFIPSGLAYGAGGSGPIPPNSPLIFEVQLMDIK